MNTLASIVITSHHQAVVLRTQGDDGTIFVTMSWYPDSDRRTLSQAVLACKPFLYGAYHVPQDTIEIRDQHRRLGDVRWYLD